MKNIFTFILIVMLSIFYFGCWKTSNEAIDKLESGANVGITQSLVIIKDSYKTKYNYEELKLRVTYKVTISGYEELAYFNAANLNIQYNLLENTGSYKRGSFSVSIKIDAYGNGYDENSFVLSGRNIKDIYFSYNFAGSATKY